MQIDDEAIILKKKKYGESSLLITFFSNYNGRNTGLVKGVLKKNFGIYEIEILTINFCSGLYLDNIAILLSYQGVKIISIYCGYIYLIVNN